MTRSLGSIYTPPELAQYLTSWAIRESHHTVLDMGIGEGAFVFAAYHRLLDIGATPVDAQHQIYGAEIDLATYGKFLSVAKQERLSFPYLHNADFFDVDFPTVDVVVGNPPYVRRTYLADVDHISQRLIAGNNHLASVSVSRLSDLYVYFLLHALDLLKCGGRFAVVTADPWLNVRYGTVLKKYLLDHCKLETLISLDRRVFGDAQVKPIVILGTKTEATERSWAATFVRVKNGLPISRVPHSMNGRQKKTADLRVVTVHRRDLGADTPWAIHFRAPKIYHKLASNPLMTPVADQALTRIGLQTLAKEFFVLSSAQAEEKRIEPEFLAPLAQSSRFFNTPTIEPDAKSSFHLFYCSKSKEELQGTSALQYILEGEAATVPVRGKGKSVTGYQNKERIQEAGRKYWYDLKTDLERRGRAAILIPRLVYRTFMVVWNRGAFVPGELFIEFRPRTPEIDAEVYLAVLASSLTETMLRLHAQVYGGGTYNVNPGQIKKVATPNPGLFASSDRLRLKQAYLEYLVDEKHDRSHIDQLVYQILGFNSELEHKLINTLQELLIIATSSKKKGSDADP